MCLFSLNYSSHCSFTALLPVLHLSRCVLNYFIFPGNIISKATALIFCSRISKVKPSSARQLSCSLEEKHFTPTANHGCSALFSYIYYFHSWVRIHNSWHLYQLQNTGTLGFCDTRHHALRAGDWVTEQELWGSREALYTHRNHIPKKRNLGSGNCSKGTKRINPL